MSNLATTIPADQIRHQGREVFPILRKRLIHYPRLRELVEQREAYGMAKYGQTLLTDDGRDTPTEIVNELLDALAYMMKYCMTHDDDWMDRLFMRLIVLSDGITEHLAEESESATIEGQ